MADDNPELEGPAPTPTEMDSAMPAGEPDGDEASASNTQVAINLDALAQAGEDDQMEKPAVGDKVQAMIEGEVASIEGGQAIVKISHVNGQEVAPEPAEPSDQDQLSELQGMAQNMPERY